MSKLYKYTNICVSFCHKSKFSCVLVIFQIAHEVADECLHLVLVAEGQEGNEPHERLQHTRVGPHEGTVDTVE